MKENVFLKLGKESASKTECYEHKTIKARKLMRLIRKNTMDKINSADGEHIRNV